MDDTADVIAQAMQEAGGGGGAWGGSLITELATPFLSGLGGALGGGSAGPSQASGGHMGGAMFDSSGWNVNFGGGSITSSRAQDQTDPLHAYMPYVVAGAGFLLLWAYLKRQK